MPIVHIHLMHGRNNDKKRALVKKVTDAICESLDVKPEKVKIVLSDMMPCDYAVGGVLKLDEDKRGK